jgi:non-heme chloroperoxidase
MLFLASNGYRCIAHDRRGHGRSSQPWNGNDMDTYADDLATLIEVVPIAAAGLASAKIVKNATLKVHPGAPHGLTDTHKEQLSADLLAFLKA